MGPAVESPRIGIMVVRQEDIDDFDGELPRRVGLDVSEFQRINRERRERKAATDRWFEENGDKLAAKQERRDHCALKLQLMKTPAVIRAIAFGTPGAEIARVLGIPHTTYRRWKRSAPVRALLEREVRRMLVHLSRRDLNDVPYEDLAKSAVMFVRAAEELKAAEPPPIEKIDRRFIRSLAVALGLPPSPTNGVDPEDQAEAGA